MEIKYARKFSSSSFIYPPPIHWGSDTLWTSTLDRYTRAGLPDCVVSTMSGPQPETTQDRTDKIHTPNPRDSTDHATGEFSKMIKRYTCYTVV